MELCLTGGVGAEVSLTDFEIFRLFKLLILLDMDVCRCHTLTKGPQATGSCGHSAKAQASGGVCRVH